jgi:hypothetical protein
MTVTIGDVIIVDDDEISDDLFRHEANHSNQCGSPLAVVMLLGLTLVVMFT